MQQRDRALIARVERMSYADMVRTIHTSFADDPFFHGVVGRCSAADSGGYLTKSIWRLKPDDPVDFEQLRRDSHVRAAWTVVIALALSLGLLGLLWLVQ